MSPQPAERLANGPPSDDEHVRAFPERLAGHNRGDGSDRDANGRIPSQGYALDGDSLKLSADWQPRRPFPRWYCPARKASRLDPIEALRYE